MVKNVFASFLIAILLSGCFGLFDSGSDRIKGRYIVLWIDSPKNQTISKEDQLHSSGSSMIIDEYVFAVGHNDEYIIAKQHPTSGFQGGYEADTTITNFYIIQMNQKTKFERDTVWGPLNESDFKKERSKLGIEAIEFDMIYPDFIP
ncbi:hypothetical protein DF185_01040 [Marinifilum breve]|uniref:DUF3997 domain-containing protein n=1 Tax=Marinifilum breve TaxID=2184082 RepID=A0A2V4A5Q7_9BACT|nr:DUF3997 domain-containing protein [Marinifilum breve]PXY02710.1 hypothetical protein DF185_01040 [Marinifilum breve]